MIPAQDLVERALAASRADGCAVVLTENTTVNLRWANNTLTTNGAAADRELTVVATREGRTGTAAGVVTAGGELDGVEELVRRAEAAANDAPPAEDAQPLVGGSESASWSERPSTTTVDVFAGFAPALGGMLERAREQARILYGFAYHRMASTFVATSSGARLRHDQPTGYVEVNAKSSDGAGSVWAGAGTRSFGDDLDLAGLERDLTMRLGWAERSVELPAGRYETILPSSAVADLMVNLYWATDARQAHDGRSPFGRAGGGTRVGERLTEVPLTLRSDPAEAGVECTPFVVATASSDAQSVFDNGVPLAPTSWVTDGVLTSLTQSRHTAALTGLATTPYIDNLVLEGPSSGDLADLVGRTRRGLLLTCLWYIREVDPRTLLLTGLTRDGVYLVEDGEVVGAVNNFRFNDSPLDLLSRVLEVGATERTLPRESSDYFTRTRMPALRVADFNMSSVSEAR